ncbi:MAG TPA: TonB-dependent receptor [Candidatus Krumholzibacteria bacterium]|nr:TonB-dependent receptor [Candidatus Krumholzibacteria bacterium]
MKTSSPGNRAFAVLAAVVLLAAAPGSPVAEEYDDFNELDLSALLDQVVVTAAKHEQTVGDSPVSAYVITAEQIAASGALSLPELLRDVPGLDVIANSSSQTDVSARGLNDLASNNVLVLIDGRSVYFDFYGVSLWESLPLAMEEIRAVEVILGPGSAYYGANAFACVINILTYDADAQIGTIVRTAAEDVGNMRASVIHGVGDEDFAWRASATFSRHYNWEMDFREGDLGRGHVKASWRTGADSRLTCDAGASRGNIFMWPAEQSLDIDGTIAHASAHFEWRDLQVRGFWNGWRVGVKPSADQVYLDFSSDLVGDVVNLELCHVVRPGGGHRVQWGGELRRKMMDWVLGDGSIEQTIVSAFVADEWKAGEALRISLGLRYDDHPLVGGHLAPRGGVVVRPGRDHALRASYGVSYRDPTFIESYWLSEVSVIPGYSQTLQGSTGLDSEQLRSLEVGYQGLLRDDLMVGLAAFRNEVRSIIDFTVGSSYPSPPAPLPGIPRVIVFGNTEGWKLLGGEAVLEARPTDALTLRGSWSYVQVEGLADGLAVERAPAHLVAASAVADAGAGHDVRLALHHRAATVWTGNLIAASTLLQEAPASTTVDLLWHWNPGGDTHLVAGAMNLFDERGRDHPLTLEQRRRWRLSLRHAF